MQVMKWNLLGTTGKKLNNVEIPKLGITYKYWWQLSSGSPRLHQPTKLVLSVLSLVTMKVMVKNCSLDLNYAI